MIKITFSILCTSVVCFEATANAQTTDADFTSLFDGKTFAGWEHAGNWVIEDDVFYRKENGGSLTYTASTVPDDFELRFAATVLNRHSRTTSACHANASA